MNLSTVTANELSYQQPLPPVDSGQLQPLLVFYLGDRAYALSIEFVVQIAPMLKLTPIPQAEQVIEGVANIHGKVVPVLCARQLLGLPLVSPRLYTPIILIHIGERMMGLIVDEVADVIHVPANQVAAPESILLEGCESETLLSGVVYQKNQAILLLNPRHLLYSAQMRAMNNAIQSMPKPAQLLPDGNGSSPDLAPASLAEITPETQTQTEGKADPVAQPGVDPETVALPGNDVAPQNGYGKPRRKRRKLEAALAGELASLAVDLPPSDGEPFGDSTPLQESSPSDAGAPSVDGGADPSPADGAVPSDMQASPGE